MTQGPHQLEEASRLTWRVHLFPKCEGIVGEALLGERTVGLEIFD